MNDIDYHLGFIVHIRQRSHMSKFGENWDESQYLAMSGRADEAFLVDPQGRPSCIAIPQGQNHELIFCKACDRGGNLRNSAMYVLGKAISERGHHEEAIPRSEGPTRRLKQSEAFGKRAKSSEARLSW